MMQDQRAAEANSYVAAAEQWVKDSPPPSGQKFAIGSRVRIADDLGAAMRHFPHGQDATVLYTYAHAFKCDDLRSLSQYALDIDGLGFNAWYDEDQLTAIPAKPA